MKLKVCRCYFFNPILPRKIFYISRKHLYPIEMRGTDIIQMVNFVPQKNTFIIQGNDTDKDNNGKRYKPKEEQEIGN